MERAYPLNRKWKIWEMWNQNKQNSLNFMETLQEIGEFDSVYTFWQHWNYFPHSDPTRLFENPETKVKIIVDGLNQSIEAIGIFEEKIIPAWEDEVNMQGCDLAIRRYPNDFDKLKDLWDNLVLSVIGENLPNSEIISGCRVVDKKANYKFELWLKKDISRSSDEKSDQLKSAFAKLFGVQVNSLNVSSHKKS